MKDFKIVSDTTCDLSKEVLNDFNIEMIKAHFMDKDGVDKYSFTDWSECDYYASSNDFYKALKANPSAFASSAPNIEEIKNFMIDIIKDGTGCLAIAMSGAMSGSYNNYLNAKKEVLKEYPDAHIEVFDSLRFGAGLGLMLVWASILRSEGKSLDEVIAFLKENRDCFHQMGWLDDLSFVAKKGRITHAKAFFGTLIGIKPLGDFDQNGMTTVLGKAKGEKAAYEAIIEYIKQTVVDPENQIMFVSHSNREKCALILKDMVEKEFKPKKLYFIETGPSCGINVGPGLNAVYYFGAKASKDLVQEKELMEKILVK
ncbi:MAG: DegV family protein [Bacilli bacterium]|nr:DegV family protein [Bacilli bacterium]